jgi:hypothetical protein
MIMLEEFLLPCSSILWLRLTLLWLTLLWLTLRQTLTHPAWYLL